jgi:phage baseplate assembly protein W
MPDNYSDLSNDPLLNKRIGQGLAFPIQLDSNGRAVVSGGSELINSSLRSILYWLVGTRFMLGEFGSMVYQLLHQPTDSVLVGLIRTYVIDAITKWEKRITLKQVNFKIISDTEVNIELVYTLANSTTQGSFVFPFYTKINT